MVEHRSPLAAVYRPGHIGVPTDVVSVAIRERVGRTLVQVTGWVASFDALCRRLEIALGCAMPGDGRSAVSHGGRSIFRVTPERLWFAGQAEDEVLRALRLDPLGDDALVTEIGDTRTVLRVAGVGARLLLNRGLPVDLDGAAFPVDAFAQSVIHAMPVLVHRIGAGECGSSDAGTFDVYVTRDYAESFWGWLTGAAEAQGCEIEVPE